MAHSLKEKKVLVFGTGAIGGYYGGMLAKTGYNVTFIARGKNYEALRQNGLTLIREDKKENLKIKVFEKADNLGIFDYILICVKSKDTKIAGESVRKNIGVDTTVVSLQNGVENEEILANILGKNHIIGGIVFVASRLVEPGIVHQFGYNGGLIGELDTKITDRIKDLQQMFANSGIDITISKDINADLWNKLVWNASFNPISVITGLTVDKILEDKKLYELTKNVMTDVKNVAIAHGYKIRPDTVEFNLERSKGFKGFKTSMLQDFERGNPLELEEIVGIVIKKAKEKNISVSAIEKVYKEVKLKEQSE